MKQDGATVLDGGAHLKDDLGFRSEHFLPELPLNRDCLPALLERWAGRRQRRELAIDLRRRDERGRDKARCGERWNVEERRKMSLVDGKKRLLVTRDFDGVWISE